MMLGLHHDAGSIKGTLNRDNAELECTRRLKRVEGQASDLRVVARHATQALAETHQIGNTR